MVTKETVNQCIENYQVALIKNLQDGFNDKKMAADIDENDVRDADAHSHQSQAQSEEQRINDQLERAKLGLEHLKRIPLTPSDKITEGALIETRNLLIYVSISTSKFNEDGQDIIGISVEAPIYKTLLNQSVGFPFQFAGIDCEIISIK